MTRTLPQETLGRVASVAALMAEPEPEDVQRWSEALALLLVDGIVESDTETLTTFLDLASRLDAANEDTTRGNALMVLAAVASHGAARSRAVASVAKYPSDGVAARILVYLHTHPMTTGKSLSEALSLPQETISRVGQQLEQESFVVRHRAGKWRAWELTPAGRRGSKALFLDRLGLTEGKEAPSVWEAGQLTPTTVVDQRIAWQKRPRTNETPTAKAPEPAQTRTTGSNIEKTL